MIYILGVNHEVQYWDGSNNPFLISLLNYAAILGLSVIAEELSAEAIHQEQKARRKTLKSTAQEAVSRLGLEHVFCDPNTAERVELRIPTDRDIRSNSVLEQVKTRP
jgi:hypothetical protein